MVCFGDTHVKVIGKLRRPLLSQTFLWFPRMELGSLGLCGKHLHLLRPFVGPILLSVLIIILFFFSFARLTFKWWLFYYRITQKGKQHLHSIWLKTSFSNAQQNVLVFKRQSKKGPSQVISVMNFLELTLLSWIQKHKFSLNLSRVLNIEYYLKITNAKRFLKQEIIITGNN